MRDDLISDRLLAWYDQNARDMPWRVGPAERKAGKLPDPYRVWLSEIMLQQTTVAAVRAYFLRFTALWPTVGDLAAADAADVMAEWAGLGYYARARNLLKCANAIVTGHGGVFPRTRDALLKLPGIGPYTAAAVASIAFDQMETVVDGNVERVVARLFDVHDPLPGSKSKLTGLAGRLTPAKRPGDYAQAVMDLGATICTPRKPSCEGCPLISECKALAADTVDQLPIKTLRKPKPTRFGIAYIGQKPDGSLLLETRPDKGLLGGMLGWPGSDWSDDPQEKPPTVANWQPCEPEARHTFTHFHLNLRVMVAQLPDGCNPKTGTFVQWDDFRADALPTVMRKVYDIGYASLCHD